LGQNTFDAVITDVMMPEMDGMTLTREISKNYPDLPVTVMTGFSDQYSARKAIADGAREFIKKPFSMVDFSLRLNKMMRGHEILCEINAKKKEIEEISNPMIFQLPIESRERVKNLRKEIRDLKKKLKGE